MQNYSERVPAVQKAIAVLDYLRSASEAPTLTQLSQSLRMNRSTLLAILNTLRAAALVVRDPRDRYHVGAGLLAYVAAAARALAPVEACEGPLQWLNEAAGESVALMALAGDEVVVALALTGLHSICAQLEPGQRSPLADSAAGLALLAALADEHALAMVDGQDAGGVLPRLDEVRERGFAILEDDAEEGRVCIAAPVVGRDVRADCALVLAGPAYRLHPEVFGQTGRMVVEAAQRASAALGCFDYAPYVHLRNKTETWRGSRSGGLQGAELEAFLAQPWVASLACLNENGYPYTVPVWYEWRETAFWLAPRAQARWATYLREHPRVSLTISEPAPPFRRVLVEGLAEEVRGQGGAGPAQAVEQRLAQRYLGQDAAGYLASAAARRESVIRIVAEKITTWKGLVAHPRYRGEPAA